MTIDEIIKYIVYEECEHCAGLFCKQNKGCRYWNILEMLRELQWYREQDLIKREDAINQCYCVYENVCEHSTHCTECLDYMIDINDLNKIPKAEPLYMRDASIE